MVQHEAGRGGSSCWRLKTLLVAENDDRGFSCLRLLPSRRRAYACDLRVLDATLRSMLVDCSGRVACLVGVNVYAMPWKQLPNAICAT